MAAKQKPISKCKSVLTQHQEELANGLLNGEKPPGASQAVKLPKVANFIATKRAELSSALQITRADAIEGMQDAVNMAKLAGDPMSMIRGWSEIAKMLGLYAPEVKKLELSMTARNLQSKYEAMSDEELLAIAEGRTNVIDGTFERLQ